ncbi:MAG TPA: ATP synthase subunit I [Burkholderiales bacterium]|nr:ATP synthase subunit I [Burkholderiales bacterium]
MALLIEGRPIRTVLKWQCYATAAIALIAGILMGLPGALSALLGGLVNITAGAVFGVVATHSRKRTAGEALIAMMRAEAGKVALIVVQLWLVLAYVKPLLLAPFFGTFVLTVIFFSAAIFVRERGRGRN